MAVDAHGCATLLADESLWEAVTSGSVLGRPVFVVRWGAATTLLAFGILAGMGPR